MYEYVSRKDVKPLRRRFYELIEPVRVALKEKGITMNYKLTGSAKRNLVLRNDDGYIDCDYQIIIHKNPNNLSAKEIKNIAKAAFDKAANGEFKDAQDSTRALTIKSITGNYGYDVIITKYDKNNNYIIYNKKDSNGANNNDYEWEIRGDLSEFHDRYKKIKGIKMWNMLRKIYREKKNNNPEGKKSYQLLNEACKEVLDKFKTVNNS